MTRGRGRIDVMILTVIQVELEAVRHALGDPAKWEKGDDETVYFHAGVPSSQAGRDYTVALACIGGAGNYDAAAATSLALTRYRPRRALLVGIAAGIKKKVRIGEVVFSERVVAYEPAAHTARGDVPRPEMPRASRTMIQDVVTHRPDANRLAAVFTQAGGKIPRASAGHAPYFRDHVARKVQAHLATVASGEKLLRDPGKLRTIQQSLHGRTEVGEMEAIGFATMCAARRVPWMVVRGVSDFGDKHKDDRFHRFAACAAAAALVEFLAHGLRLGTAGTRSGTAPRARSRPPAGAVAPAPPAAAVAAAAEASRPEARAAWDEWLARMAARASCVRLPGATQPFDLDLGALRVELSVAVDDEQDGSLEPIERRLGRGSDDHRKTVRDALAYARAYRSKPVGLAVIGEPGAGKSTLLRQIMLDVRAHGAVDVGFPHALVPVLLAWTDVAALLEARPPEGDGALALEAVLEAAAEAAGQPGAGRDLARSGVALLVMFDGLDEVHQAETRRRACEWLSDHVVHSRPGSWFVVTCRWAAWHGGLGLSNRFVQVNVLRLSRDAVEELLRRYADALAKERKGIDADALVASLRAALLPTADEPRSVAQTPLLLAQMCAVAASRPGAAASLPRTRLGLHSECVATLLAQAHKDRRARRSVPEQAGRAVLQPLAWYMQMVGDRAPLVTLARVIADAVEYAKRPVPVSRARPEPTAIDASLTAEGFIQRMWTGCGLLDEPDPDHKPDELRFVHLSLQEALAAADVQRAGRHHGLADRAADPRWREVTLLTCAAGGLGAYVKALVEFETSLGRSMAAHRDLLVACVSEALSEQAAHGGSDRQLAPEPQADPKADPPLLDVLTRAAKGELGGIPTATVLLEALGRRAPEGVVAKARELVAIAALARAARAVIGVARHAKDFDRPAAIGATFLWMQGATFWMGSSKARGLPNRDPDADGDELPAHEVTVDAFWMAEVPVTNRDYRRYLDAGARGEGVPEPRYWDDARFTGEDQPVVGVSWHEALRYCAWLTKVAPPPDGMTFRLPTEAEWELAARGTTGRKYPWGDDAPTLERADHDQDYRRGKPLPVGGHEAGRSVSRGALAAPGALGLAGGVWEWCLDVWVDSYDELTTPAKNPCQRPVRRADEDARGGSRVVRGGSWGSGARLLRSACRFQNLPQVRFRNLGFRVVCGGSRQHG